MMEKKAIAKLSPDVIKGVRKAFEGKEDSHPYYDIKEKPATGRAMCRSCGVLIEESEPALSFQYAQDDERPWMKARMSIHSNDCGDTSKEWTKCPRCKKQVPNDGWSAHWKEHRYAANLITSSSTSSNSGGFSVTIPNITMSTGTTSTLIRTTKRIPVHVDWDLGVDDLRFSLYDSLPIRVHVPEELFEDVDPDGYTSGVADWLSDEHGFLVNAWHREDKDPPLVKCTWCGGGGSRSDLGKERQQICMACKGSGIQIEDDWCPLNHGLEKGSAKKWLQQIEGRGKSRGRGQRWRDRRDEVLSGLKSEDVPSYYDEDSSVFENDEGWRVVPIKTIGDAMYEGGILSHCLGNPKVQNFYHQQSGKPEGDNSGDFFFPGVPLGGKDYMSQRDFENTTARGNSRAMSLRDPEGIPKATFWEPKEAPQGTSLREVAGFSNQKVKPEYLHPLHQYMRQGLEKAGLDEGEFEHIGIMPEGKEDRDAFIYEPIESVRKEDLPEDGAPYKKVAGSENPDTPDTPIHPWFFGSLRNQAGWKNSVRKREWWDPSNHEDFSVCDSCRGKGKRSEGAGMMVEQTICSGCSGSGLVKNRSSSPRIPSATGISVWKGMDSSWRKGYGDDPRESFDDALDRYKGKNYMVGIGNNTGLHEDKDNYHIRLHNTDILSFNKSTPEVSVNLGGWDTVTTKQRINSILPSGINLYSEKIRPASSSFGRSWDNGNSLVLHTPAGGYEYKEGMTVNMETGLVPGVKALNQCPTCKRYRTDDTIDKHLRYHENHEKSLQKMPFGKCRQCKGTGENTGWGSGSSICFGCQGSGLVKRTSLELEWRT